MCAYVLIVQMIMMVFYIVLIGGMGRASKHVFEGHDIIIAGIPDPQSFRVSKKTNFP